MMKPGEIIEVPAGEIAHIYAEQGPLRIRYVGAVDPEIEIRNDVIARAFPYVRAYYEDLNAKDCMAGDPHLAELTDLITYMEPIYNERV